MKRKINTIGEVKKWKARLFDVGNRLIEGIYYCNTYSPVVSWRNFRLIICMDIIMDWHKQLVSFVLAFPQDPIKSHIYMRPLKVTKGFNILDLQHSSDVFTKLYMLLKTYMILRMMESLGLISLKIKSSIGAGNNRL